jgi:hypothetical protein
MKKQLVIIGFILIMNSVWLSGCDQQTTSENPVVENPRIINTYKNDIRISNLKVVTKVIGDHSNDSGKTLSTQSGFNNNHNRVDPGYVEYVVSGTIQNIGSRIIDRADITVHFYNDKGNFLYDETTPISSLYLDDTQSFNVILTDKYYVMDYFYYVSDYKLEITEVNFH